MRLSTKILMILTVLAAVAALPAWSGAQDVGSAGAGSAPRVIDVTGQGAVVVTPDQATVTLGVQTIRQTAQDAQNANNAAVAQVVHDVTALGIPADQLRTTGITLTAQRRTVGGNTQITGYAAANQIAVTVNDLKMTGRVIDAGVGAGANEVASLSFELRDSAADRTRALRLAVQDARATATVLAQAAGVGPLHLVRLVNVGETSPIIRFAAAQDSVAAAATPVLPGTVSVTASVQAEYNF